MMKKIGQIGIASAVLILSACATPQKVKCPSHTWLYTPHTTVNQLEVSGPFDVKVIVGARKNRIIVSGTDHVRVSQNSKEVAVNKSFWKRSHHPVKVTAYLKSLRGLILEGVHATVLKGNLNRLTQLKYISDSNLTLLDLRRDFLSIVKGGAGRLTLRGYINNLDIQQAGHGKVDAFWVKGQHVTVKAEDQSFTKLAGRTKELNVDLADHAELYAPFLRADNVKIKTSDYAIARGFSQKHLFIQATGESQVGYRGNPKHIYHLVKDAAAVYSIQ